MSSRVGAALGTRRFSENRMSRYIGKAASVFKYAPVVNGIKIVIYNTEGTKLAEISNEVQKGILYEASFELVESGCGDFSFTLLKEFTQIEITYNHRIDIHLFGSQTPWYSGYVMTRPKPGNTSRTFTYGGFGFFNQLKTCIMDYHYYATTFPAATDRCVSKVVDHIARTFIEPKTEIVYNCGKIDGMSFVITDMDFDKTSVKDALSDIVDIAQDYVVGVDEVREFFFRPVKDEVNPTCIKFTGKHIQTVLFSDDTFKIRNKLYIKSGTITDGSNYICTVEDAASQATYGVLEDVLTIPTALATEDAQRWGEYKLSKLKDPVQKAKVTGIDINGTLIRAEGKARIYDKEGRSYEYPIKKVIYKIVSSGITADLELGELDRPLAEEILEMMRDLKNQEYLQASNVAQLSP